MKLNKQTKILIVGLGLIGGSYADALSSKGYTVGALDTNQEALQFALKAGYIAHGRDTIDPNYLADFDVVIFALYPHTFIQWIKDNQHYLKPQALITDVTGVKTCIVYDIQKILRPDLEFIAAHPMAGKEVCGVENASRSIFHEANYLVTPTPLNTPSAINFAKELGYELGFCKVSELSPEEHDEMIGFLSQLTHCIAISLMTCKDSKKLVNYTGDSFRDLTRIAHINENMWSELFLANKDKLLEQMDLFINQFQLLKEYIKTEDIRSMKEMMRTSTEHRNYFNKK